MSDIRDYQDWTDEVAIYPEAGTGSLYAVIYAVLGLVNEAGEVAGKLKKVMRDQGALELTPEELRAVLEPLIPEAGDVEWYLARIFRELGTDFDTVAAANREKLDSRKERGVLRGSGDNR